MNGSASCGWLGPAADQRSVEFFLGPAMSWARHLSDRHGVLRDRLPRRFQERRVAELLQGYTEVRSMSAQEMAVGPVPSCGQHRKSARHGRRLGTIKEPLGPDAAPAPRTLSGVLNMSNTVLTASNTAVASALALKLSGSFVDDETTSSQIGLSAAKKITANWRRHSSLSFGLYIPSFLVSGNPCECKAREEHDAEFGVCTLHRRGWPMSVAWGRMTVSSLLSLRLTERRCAGRTPVWHSGDG